MEEDLQSLVAQDVLERSKMTLSERMEALG